jgi:hypothetical protein
MTHSAENDGSFELCEEIGQVSFVKTVTSSKFKQNLVLAERIYIF